MTQQNNIKSSDKESYTKSKKKGKGIPSFIWIVIGIVIFAGIGYATTINENGVLNTPRVYFGNSSGLSGDAPTRELVTTAQRRITVCGSGCDYTTIQDAVNQAPYIMRHNYTISISAGTYNEDVWVPPISVGDIISSTEGSVGALKITGVCNSINDVRVKSFHVTNNVGSGVTTIQCMEVFGKEPTSDENTSIAIYGSNQVQIAHINFTSQALADYGVMLYSSNGYFTDFYFNNMSYGFLVKRLSFADISDLTSIANSGMYGNLKTALVNVNSGVVDIVQSNVTVPNLVACGAKSGFAKQGQNFYCMNRINSALNNLTIQKTDVSLAGGAYYWLQRNTGEDEGIRFDMTDNNWNWNLYQDDDSNGFHKYIYDFRASAGQNISRSSYEFNFNGANGLVIMQNNITASYNMTFPQSRGSGNALACFDANGKLYRGNTTGCP